MGKNSTPTFIPEFLLDPLVLEEDALIDQNTDLALQKILKSIQSIDIEMDEVIMKELMESLNY